MQLSEAAAGARLVRVVRKKLQQIAALEARAAGGTSPLDAQQEVRPASPRDLGTRRFEEVWGL